MHIVVKSKEVEVKKGVARSGKPYEIFEQTAYLHTGDEIRRVTVPLRSGQSPYAPGNYAIDPDSYAVDRFGGLGIGRLQLVAMPPVAAQAKVG